ncbi:MAG: undecaprenyldiphospho-muramoylpentapeptide beta-N-acetylglucosaminyltransferase [Mariprofundaceae bacterium]|nr:undecaprenyldiphospho-muramoylpentapeptide beta-N-acetylglucosaminyltransferase [Mariprofundaceae bacterium]
MQRHLCIVGGGTGGHVFPALALADAVRRRWSGAEVTFIGAERGLEAELLPERGEQVLLLGMHSVQGAGILQKLRVLFWELPRAVLCIRRHWRLQRPHLVVGVGGYASVAGVLAAVVGRVPVVLYEQNAVPGMVNRKLARFCQLLMLGFADAARWLPEGKTCFTGNLVADAIRAVRWQAHQPPRLIVLGGSQGAQVFNETLPAACRLLRNDGHDFQVTHVAGAKQRLQALQEAYAEAGVDAQVLDFCRDMPVLYGEADLLLARAGAMTVCEAALVGLPAVFVPLPHAADNHQWFNAQALATAGGAVVVKQRDLSAASLANNIATLLFEKNKLAQMSKAARKAQPQDSEERMLDILGRWLEVPA